MHMLLCVYTKCVSVYVYVCTCVQKVAYVHVCTYVCTHACGIVYMYTYIYMWPSHSCMYAIHTYMRTHRTLRLRI